MINPFIHLRVLSSYSLSESSLKINQLVALANKNNMPAIEMQIIIICLESLSFKRMYKNNIQPIIGTLINFLDIVINNQISQFCF